MINTNKTNHETQPHEAEPLHADSSQQQDQQVIPSSTIENTNKKQYKKNPLREHAMIISQYGLLLCNIFVIFILLWQLRHFGKQTAIFQDQLENGQRAWVTLKQADHTEIQEGRPVGVRIIFTNSGNSPALNLTINTNIQFRSAPVPAPMSLAPSSSQEPSKGVVGTMGILLMKKPVMPLLQKKRLKISKSIKEGSMFGVASNMTIFSTSIILLSFA